MKSTTDQTANESMGKFRILKTKSENIDSRNFLSEDMAQVHVSTHTTKKSMGTS